MDSNKFYALNETTLVDYIKSVPALAERLGNCNAQEITVREVGDGNLNFVYIVIWPQGSFVIKQAVPYIRCIGESWLMTKERAYFEVTALKEHGQFCPEHVPEVYYFDRGMALFAMRYLEPPHIILRKGLIAGVEYPLLAEHISDYMAKTLFHTSLLYLSTTEHKAEVARFCSNVEMCRLTEQVIFSDPYMLAPNNRWSSPYLDEDAKALQEDNQLKVEIAELKSKFCERTQALIHGDLHTDSVMVTSSSTQVIDPEFAFYGLIGFDIGAFIGNLILAFFSQDGHGNSENQRKCITGEKMVANDQPSSSTNGLMSPSPLPEEAHYSSSPDALTVKRGSVMSRKFNGYSFTFLPKGLPFVYNSGPSRCHNDIGIDCNKYP